MEIYQQFNEDGTPAGFVMSTNVPAPIHSRQIKVNDPDEARGKVLNMTLMRLEASKIRPSQPIEEG